jgi:hypothetical protein
MQEEPDDTRVQELAAVMSGLESIADDIERLLAGNFVGFYLSGCSYWVALMVHAQWAGSTLDT